MPFNVAGRKILVGIASCYFALYFYYCGWSVSSGRVLGEVSYAVGLYNHTMRGAIAERVADGCAVGAKAVRTVLGLTDDATS
jgi:hypothetical protein